MVSDGHAHVTTGMDRRNFTLGPNEKAMMFVTNPGSSGMCGAMVQWSSAGVIWENFVMPTLAGSANGPGVGGPTAGRAMKASLSILNSTASRKIGGTVLTLNATQRIVWPTNATTNLSVEQANDLYTQIENQAQTRLQTGEFYKTAKCMRCHPNCDVDYTGFRPFQPSATGSSLDPHSTTNAGAPQAALTDIDRFLECISTCTPYNSANGDTVVAYPNWHELQKRPMSTICVLFASPPESQTYTFSVRGTYYTKWPMEHVLGQHHPPIPSASPGVVSRLKDVGEHFKDVVHDAADGAAAVGSGVASVFQMGSQAYSLYTQLQRARGVGTGMAIADALIPMID
jgi:hypothetical protein